MLHILLTILKIIGIILLAIIGLIILIAVCILFAPVRYSADIKYKNELALKAKLSYLLHLITVRYDIANKEIDIRILGIKTHFFNKASKEKKRKLDEETEMFEKMAKEMSDSKAKNEEEKEATEEIHEKYEELKKINQARDEMIDSTNSVNQSEKAYDNSEKEDIDENSEDFEEEFHEKKNIFKRQYDKIIAFVNKIKYRIRSFCGTIKKIFKHISEIKEFIQDENTREAYDFAKEELIQLIKHIRPRRIKGFIHFGFDDPSYTGKLLGLIYIFTHGTHKNFQINADFENRVLEGEAHIKGRVQVYFLLILAFKLYKNENIKKVIERRRTYGRE